MFLSCSCAAAPLALLCKQPGSHEGRVMVVRVATVAFEGIEAKPVDVQVQILPGNVVFNIVGLGDKAVTESRERVRSALVASGLAMPAKRITVNLAPADMPKEGSHYDLPIALAVMAAIGAIPADALAGFTVLGELALDGTLTPVAGVLPAAVAANARGHGLICPGGCGPEAGWASCEIDVIAPRGLVPLANDLKGTAALAGAGLHARPGEVSLAHHGVLFLDELPEFSPQALDSLRQPLEIGEVAISRANHRVVYPARFQLVAAMNPCRCGHAIDPGYACRRQPNERCAAQYQARLSGPLIDRIDLQIEVLAVSAADLILPPPTEGSTDVAARVAAARELQRARYSALGLPGLTTNAAAPAALIEDIARPDTAGSNLVRDAAERMRLSARGFHRVLKLARTIADLAGSPLVRREHLAEALSYRPRSTTTSMAA